jgi:hypothetical protein
MLVKLTPDKVHHRKTTDSPEKRNAQEIKTGDLQENVKLKKVTFNYDAQTFVL